MFTLILGLLLTLIIFKLILIPLYNLSFYQKQGLPTTFFPVIGFHRALRKGFYKDGDFLKDFKDASKINPNQKGFASNFGSNIVIHLRDPNYIKEFLQNPSNYRKAKFLDILRILVGNGLLFAEGDTWKSRRKIISASFHYDFLRTNTALIQETTREILDKIPSQEYKGYNLMDMIQRITGEVVGRLFFGGNLNRYDFGGEPLTLALANLIAALSERIPTLPYMILGNRAFSLPIQGWREMARKVLEFRAQCCKIIEDRRRDGQKYHDLLDSLLEYQKTSEEGGGDNLTDEDIVNEFVTFFLAGMDTTGHLVTMVLYNLTLVPEYLLKLKQEREKIYKTNHPITAEALQGMDVLNSVLKETLRYSTPVPWVLTRESLTDHAIKDLQIKKGTLVKADFISNFYHANNFEEPEQFKPERWQDPNLKLDAFSFAPFSGGPRNCIGQHLAMLEAKIIVSEFLEKFNYQVSQPYQLKMALRFLYEPYKPIKIDLSPKITS